MRCSHRPLRHGRQGNLPRLIVIHAMGEYILHEGVYKHAVQFLDDVGLSAHALVAPDGEIIRCRSDEQVAWHARGHNRDSLSTEFLVPGRHDYGSFIRSIHQPGWVTEEAFESGVEQSREWHDVHDIEADVRHSDIDPDRKQDPGRGFPWDLFLQAVRA